MFYVVQVSQNQWAVTAGDGSELISTHSSYEDAFSAATEMNEMFDGFELKSQTRPKIDRVKLTGTLACRVSPEVENSIINLVDHNHPKVSDVMRKALLIGITIMSVDPNRGHQNDQA